MDGVTNTVAPFYLRYNVMQVVCYKGASRMNARLYVLLLLLLIPFGVAAQSNTVTPNTPIIVEMTDGKPVQLIYNAVGNEIISVSVRSLEDENLLDTTLEVIAPTGASIAENDDHGSDRMDLAQTDSLIAELALTDGGEYVIVVDTFSGVAQGSMEVLLTTNATAQPTAEPTTLGTGDEIIEGTVAQGDVFTSEFSAETGETVTITVRGVNGFDPRVSLTDSKGRTLVENDDHGSDDGSLGRFDSRIDGFTFVAGGTFTITISGYDNTGGDFTLEITRGGAVPIDTEQVLETFQATVNNGEAYAYDLNAEEGDVYTISARSLDGALDPIIAIYDQDDNLAAYNDDHGDPSANLARFDSRVTRWIVPASGRFFVEVSGYQGGGGEFELTLERIAQNAPVGVPDETVFTGESNGQSTFEQTFEARAGDWVTVSVRGLSGNFDPYAALIAPDGTVLAENTDHGQRTVTLAFIDAIIPNYLITVEGEYTISVLSEDGNSGEFAITVAVQR